MKDDIADIRDRVARHDLRYDALPCTYFEGFILGNGDLGAVLWFEEDRMVLSLDKADVWERRADQSLEPGMDYRTALQQVRDGSFDPSCRVFDPVRPPDRVWGNKLPIGRVEWPLGQTPMALEGKIALYEAAFSLELRLEQGTLTVWGYLHAGENIVELEMEAHGKIPLPTCSVARRLDERSEEIVRIWDYPETEYGGQGTDRYLVQGYSGDEQYAVFVRQCHVASNRARCAVTVVRGAAGDELPARAAAAVEAWQGRDDLFDEHLTWWARFWTRSHLQVPDAALERLWYAEMYKLGCNARADKYPVTIMGVWNPDTRIPPCYGDLHHNLETEMNYWPIFAANRLELAMPLYELLVDQLPRFEENCRTFFGWSGAYLPANMDIYGQGVGFMWFPLEFAGRRGCLAGPALLAALLLQRRSGLSARQSLAFHGGRGPLLVGVSRSRRRGRAARALVLLARVRRHCVQGPGFGVRSGAGALFVYHYHCRRTGSRIGRGRDGVLWSGPRKPSAASRG